MTLASIHSESNNETNQAGSQNYVGIYPPLYYGVVGQFLQYMHIRDVHHQAYIARLFSVLIFGIFGVLLDRMLRRVLKERYWRAAVVYSVPLLFPTLAMLGGVVNNDILMDTMCLSLFCVILDALHREVWTKWAAVMYGIVFGLALITKPDVYVVAPIAGIVIISRLWRTVKPRRHILSWIGVGALPLVLLAAPWFVVAAHYYHSVLPPLTYQATGRWPRTAEWFVTHLFTSPTYQMNVMVYQTVSGINFPWWVQPVQSQIFYNAWIVVISGLLVYGTYKLIRSNTTLFGISLLWIAIVYAFLWYTTYTYLLKTGTHFLQGRYFFMMLPPVLYILAVALNRRVGLLRLLPLFSAFVSATVLNATVHRFYGSNLLSMVGGYVLTYDPAAIVILGRISMGVLCVMLLWCVLRIHSDDQTPPVS